MEKTFFYTTDVLLESCLIIKIYLKAVWLGFWSFYFCILGSLEIMREHGVADLRYNPVLHNLHG